MSWPIRRLVCTYTLLVQMWLPQKMCPHGCFFLTPQLSSATMRLTFMAAGETSLTVKCSPDFSVSLRVNSKNSGNHLTFHPAPSSGQNISFPNMLVEDCGERRTLWPSWADYQYDLCVMTAQWGEQGSGFMRGCTVFFLSLVPHFLKIEIWLLSNECEESREDRHHRDRLNAKL